MAHLQDDTRRKLCAAGGWSAKTQTAEDYAGTTIEVTRRWSALMVRPITLYTYNLRTAVKGRQYDSEGEAAKYVSWTDNHERYKIGAMKDGVLIEAGDAFFNDDAPLLNYFRLAYSAISSERIPGGVARLAAVMRSLKP